MHVFGQKLILISLAVSQKNKNEKWPLITLVQCKHYTVIDYLGIGNDVVPILTEAEPRSELVFPG